MFKISTENNKPDAQRLMRNVQNMMDKGIKLGDIEGVKNQMGDIKDALAEQLAENYALDNPESPKQVIEVLKRMSDAVPMGEKDVILEHCYVGDDTNRKWTSSKSALEALSNLGYQFATDMIEYRSASKCHSTLKSLLNAADGEGLVHPDVELAKTNRINYKNPGILTIPKDLLKYVIVARRNGDSLYSIDVKNQEPGIIINVIGDEGLKELLMKSKEEKEGLYEEIFKKLFKPVVTMNLLVDTLPEDRIYQIEEFKQYRHVSPASYQPKRALCQSWFEHESGKRVVAVETICQGVSQGCEVVYPETCLIELEGGNVKEVEIEWEKVKVGRKDVEVKGYLKGIDMQLEPYERKQIKRSLIAISYESSYKGIEEMCTTLDPKTVYHGITSFDKLKEYRKICSDLARSGRQYIKTAFGSVVWANKFGGSGELKRSLASIPMQGTGADLLDLLVDHMDVTAKEKFGNEFKFVPETYYTRNDELIVEVPYEIEEKYGEEYIKEWLSDTLTHQVDDWVPFEVEVEKVEHGDIRELLVDDEE